MNFLLLVLAMISVSSAVSLTFLNPPDCSEEGDIQNRINVCPIRFVVTVYNQLYFRFRQQVDHMH